jgi:cytoskeletal protein RodZ
MTRLFGHKKDKTTIAELEEYYANQDQKKTKTGKAWFMAFLSILLTVAIVLALFFAGRWLYRTITNDSSDNSATTSENTNGGEQVDLPTFDGDVVGQGNQPGENTDSSGSDSTSGSSSTSNTEGNTENAGVVSDEAASTSESNAERVAGTNNAGGIGGEPIPNTGAGDFLIVIPFVTAIAGYYISRKHYSKQN